MKIVIAAGIYPPDIGGPATYSQTIAREFSKKGIKVSVVCYSDNVGLTMSHMVSHIVKRVLRKHAKPIRYFLYFWNLLKLARGCDVIYAQGPLAAGLPAMWVSRILRKKFIVKIVGDYAWEQHQNKLKVKSLPARAFGSGRWQAGQKLKVDDIETFQKNKYDFLTELRRKIQKVVVSRAKKIIVPSEFLKRIVGTWGIDEKKIKVIYNSFSKPGKTKAVELDGEVIISAGRPEPWKGFDTLREIMPDLLKENSKFRLIIATRFPHDELMGYFKASKMFVLNSGYEGFSHIILEAMASGLPVITTNVCGNPEIVQDGYNGLLVEYNNKEQIKEAILRLWGNEELRNKFIENGKNTARKFNLEKMINETLKILKS